MTEVFYDPLYRGWFWWRKPRGDPHGPFPSEADARADLFRAPTLYQIEVKHGCRWIATHAPFTDKAAAYRTAIKIYGAEFWKQFLGGTRTVRVVVKAG